MGCETKCMQCGEVTHDRALCEDCEYHLDDPDYGPDPSEPIGSCDECGCNLYPDDEWDGLCNQCAWLAMQ